MLADTPDCRKPSNFGHMISCDQEAYYHFDQSYQFKTCRVGFFIISVFSLSADAFVLSYKMLLNCTAARMFSLLCQFQTMPLSLSLEVDGYYLR